MKQLAFVLAVTGCVLLSSLVSADSLGPPPTDCPVGAQGRSHRVGEWCAPTSCDAQNACQGRLPRCSEAELALCVRAEHRTGHRRTPRGVVTVERDIEVALGPCDTRGRCAEGAECQRARRCLPAIPSPSEASAMSEAAAPTPTPTPPTRAEVSLAEAPAANADEPNQATSGCTCRASSAHDAPWAAAVVAVLVGVALLRRR